MSWKQLEHCAAWTSVLRILEISRFNQLKLIMSFKLAEKIAL
jgi:hypothetical protein